MQSQSNYYLAPICAICGSLNLGYLLAQGIKLVVLDDFLWIVAIVVCLGYWTAIGMKFFTKEVDLANAEFITQVYLFAVPLAGNIGVIWGIFN